MEAAPPSQAAESEAPSLEAASGGGAGLEEATASGAGTGLVDATEFAELMEGALKAGKGVPRGYLMPVSSVKQSPDEPTFQPKIDPHSKASANFLAPHLRINKKC